MARQSSKASELTIFPDINQIYFPFLSLIVGNLVASLAVEN